MTLLGISLFSLSLSLSLSHTHTDYIISWKLSKMSSMKSRESKPKQITFTRTCVTKSFKNGQENINLALTRKSARVDSPSNVLHGLNDCPWAGGRWGGWGGWHWGTLNSGLQLWTQRHHNWYCQMRTALNTKIPSLMLWNANKYMKWQNIIMMKLWTQRYCNWCCQMLINTSSNKTW